MDKDINNLAEDWIQRQPYFDPNAPDMINKVTEATGIIRKLLIKVTQLENELDDWRTSSEKVLNDECSPDERHCTCVPFLRKRIAELEDDCKTLARIIYSAAKDLDDVLKGK